MIGIPYEEFFVFIDQFRRSLFSARRKMWYTRGFEEGGRQGGAGGLTAASWPAGALGSAEACGSFRQNFISAVIRKLPLELLKLRLQSSDELAERDSFSACSQ
jgi:hypothetical protein